MIPNLPAADAAACHRCGEGAPDGAACVAGRNFCPGCVAKAIALLLWRDTDRLLASEQGAASRRLPTGGSGTAPPKTARAL